MHNHCIHNPVGCGFGIFFFFYFMLPKLVFEPVVLFVTVMFIYAKKYAVNYFHAYNEIS